ncbi:MAG: putative glycolipid-binding domain-containing protein [Acetobacteraceae bacterium]
MPIRRLAFVPDVPARLRVAYVTVLSLEVVQREQEYALISPGRFRYRNPESGFTAEVEVDAEGLVERYGEIWRRAWYQESYIGDTRRPSPGASRTHRTRALGPARHPLPEEEGKIFPGHVSESCMSESGD